MPETRYRPVEVFDGKGKLLGTEPLSYEVSDEELAAEESGKVVAELDGVDDAHLTLAQLSRLVRALAKAGRLGK